MFFPVLPYFYNSPSNFRENISYAPNLNASILCSFTQDNASTQPYFVVKGVFIFFGVQGFFSTISG
jgi:hypothetical protein